MKKTLKIKLILNFILIIGFSSSLIGQWAITTRNNTHGGGDYLQKVDANCKYNACFTTYVYSPDQIPFDDGVGFNEGIPAMYLRIKILDIDQTYALTNWTAESFNTFGIEGLYKSTVCIELSLHNQCLNDFLPTDGSVDPESETEIPYIKELLMSDGNGEFTHYPICSYVDENSIFSCEIFHTSEPFCDNDEEDSVCLNSELYRYEGNLVLKCKECIVANYGDNNGKNNVRNENNRNNRNNRRSKSSKTIELSPNPFIDNITISNLGSKGISEIKVMTNLGQEIKSIETSQSKISISTLNYDSGVYYLIVSKNGFIETFKIVKI